ECPFKPGDTPDYVHTYKPKLPQKQLEASREFWAKALASLKDELKLDGFIVEIYDGWPTDKPNGFIRIITNKFLYNTMFADEHVVEGGTYLSLEKLKEVREAIKDKWSRLDAEIQQR